MSARHVRDDYPMVREFEWGHRSGGENARRQITALFAEVELLRAVAVECWEWDDGEELPGLIPELLSALGERSYLAGSGPARNLALRQGNAQPAEEAT
jgi:hypothetical protein